MLKLSISATLLQAASRSLMSITNEVVILQKEHPFLVKKEKESIEREAKMFKMTVEEVIKDRQRLKATSEKSPLDKLPLISNITNFNSKIVSVIRTEEEVTVTLNEDFVQGAIKIGTDMAVKAAKPLVDFISVLDGYADDVLALKAKWKEDEEDKVEVESKTVPASEVPEKVRAKVEETKKKEFNGWSFDTDVFPTNPKPLFLDEEKETYKLIYDLSATRGEEKFRCSPNVSRRIIQDKENTVIELADHHEIPSSLVKALFEYYGVELTDRQLGLETPAVNEHTPAVEE